MPESPVTRRPLPKDQPEGNFWKSRLVWACLVALAILVGVLGNQVWYGLNGWRSQASASASRLYGFLANHKTKEASEDWFADSGTDLGKRDLQSLEDKFGEVTEFNIVDRSESGPDEEIVVVRVKRKMGGSAKELLYVSPTGLVETVNRVE